MRISKPDVTQGGISPDWESSLISDLDHICALTHLLPLASAALDTPLVWLEFVLDFLFFFKPIKLAKLALPQPVPTTIQETTAASTGGASEVLAGHWWNPSRQAGGQAGQFSATHN